MATPRLATSPILRASRSCIRYSARKFRAFPICSSRPVAPAPVLKTSQFRPYSQDATKSSKIYYFEDVKGFLEKPDPNRFLIDTREPPELHATGTMPGALNIPVTSQPDAFFITAEEFEDRFGFERPGKDQEVVFYCKAGVRSKAAAELARQAGWGAIAEYPGSWMDWEKNGGVKEGRKS